METKNKVIRDAEDELFSQHSQEFFEKYSGRYMGIVERKVVIIDEDFGKVFRKVTEEYLEKIPGISCIPREDELELLVWRSMSSNMRYKGRFHPIVPVVLFTRVPFH